MPGAWTYAQLVALVEELSARNTEQARVIAAQGERIVDLERRLGQDPELVASTVVGCAVG